MAGPGKAGIGQTMRWFRWIVMVYPDDLRNIVQQCARSVVTFQGCKVINRNLQIELQSDVFLWNPEKTHKLFYIINNIFGPPVWLRALWLPLCPFFDGHGLPPGAPDTGLLAGHKERKAGVTLDSLGRAFNSPAWETSVDKPARLIDILCWFQMPEQSDYVQQWLKVFK